MRKVSLFWKLYPTYILVILLSAGVVGGYAIDSVQRFHYERFAAGLEVRTYLVARHIEEAFGEIDSEALSVYVSQIGQGSATRITIIAPDGRVIADSHAEPARMDNHADRPEFQAALARKDGLGIRHSYTVDSRLMYLAMPIERDSRVVGVVRSSTPVTEINEVLASLYARIAVSGLFVALVAAGVGYFVSRRLSRSFNALRLGAQRFASGDFTYKLPDSDIREMAALSRSFNRMAARLDGTIATISRQRNEQQAILSSMTEGVLAVDTDERVISLNDAAGSFLAVRSAQAEGRMLQEVVRNRDLESIVARVLASDADVQDEITFPGDGLQCQLVLEVRGTTLRDSAALPIGAVLVFNDVTRLRRLENLRRDFVANVSHELKTPITSIKGFVETLREGAFDDPARARRFLEIVARHVNRLDAIIDDLLALSRLDQEGERAEIDTQECRVADILSSAVAECASRAQERAVEVSVECASELAGSVNTALVEQAVINLLDNAIKYSERGGAVVIEAERADDSELVIRVRDTGCGIERKHLPRLFERFYRADKARSRSLGGTGLGLAIVKHIVQAHGGSVAVESTPGKGSTFTIRLP